MEKLGNLPKCIQLVRSRARLLVSKDFMPLGKKMHEQHDKCRRGSTGPGRRGSSDRTTLKPPPWLCIYAAFLVGWNWRCREILLIVMHVCVRTNNYIHQVLFQKGFYLFI